MELVALLIPVFAYALGIVILYSVVKHGTKSDSVNKELLRQSLFLEAMARKQGVSEEELAAINKSIDKVTKHF